MSQDYLTEITALSEALGAALKQRGWKLVTAESCTGGWIAQAVTAVPGSSAWFERGYITYSNRAKQEDLNVQVRTLTEAGAVSEATVREMALGALGKSGANIAVAVSGIAGPSGGTPQKPVGTVCLAWAQQQGGVRSEMHTLAGDRAQVRATAVAIALRGLLQLLAR